MRFRLLDYVVAAVCAACVAAPVLTVAVSSAADVQAPVAESGGSVDQKVLQSGIMSFPLNGTFDKDRSGVANGSVQWDLYTTASDGMKLVLSSDRVPAMRDAQNGIDIPDEGAGPDGWSVGSGQRAFGFTVLGDLALGKFGDGTKWRGFDGKRAVEIGRKGTLVGRTRTTVRLRAEFAQALPSDARPTANIRATAVANL
jgi:hypothetical protein